ncbi:response regulator transcription factor [Rhizobium leguminosarum]|uniref:response regulator transcription factor n=1 Tax=Rhizobium leguminosarum TaxID=384 RepID=UPI0016792042
MMLAAGLCRKEIANVMGVSQAAVCQHIQSATKILNLPRKDSALVALAFRSGWVS